MIVQFEQLFNLNALTIRGDQAVRDRKKVGNPWRTTLNNAHHGFNLLISV